MGTNGGKNLISSCYNPIAPYIILRRGSGEGGADLFSLESSYRMHGSGLKLHQGRLRLDMRKHFFAERVVKHWNSVLFPERWPMPQAGSS